MKELSVLKFHYANSSYLGTPLLTDRNAHDKFLSQVNIQNEYSKYNSVMQQLHLETPIVENVSIDSIIRLKEAEEDAFENYKITLKKSIQSFVKEKDSITSEMIQEFYNDNIASELINLNRKMRNSKSLATKNFRWCTYHGCSFRSRSYYSICVTYSPSNLRFVHLLRNNWNFSY